MPLKVDGSVSRKVVSRNVAVKARDERINPKNGAQTSGSRFEEPNTKDCAPTATNALNRPKKQTQSWWVLSMQSSVDLAPRPGLEPGTCGLTVRRFRCQNSVDNQALMFLSVGSVFWHLMGVSAPQEADAPN